MVNVSGLATALHGRHIMHLRRLTATLVATAPLLILSAIAPLSNAVTPDERVTTTSWTPLTSSVSPNFAQASVVRTADGMQHVVWVIDEGAGHNYEHTTISPSGVQGPVTRILAPNWAQLSTPVDLGVNADGSLRLAFRGSIDGSTDNFYSFMGVYTATSIDGGASWTLPREVLAKSLGDGGVTLAYLPDGTPITGYGDTGGFHWNVGTVSEAALPTATVQEFTDHDALQASLVAHGAAVYVIYQSIRADGVFARQVWPTLGAPLRAPGTSNNPGLPLASVDRPGVGPVAAYTVNSKVVLWDVLANATHAVRGMTGPTNLALAALPDAHMWVAAAGPIGYDPRASRVAASGWNVDRSPTLLDDLDDSFGLEVGSGGTLRAELLLTGNDSGDPSRIHAQSVKAQMILRASPRRWRVGSEQRVVFKVTDVDGAVARARVRADGRRCTTNRSGRCTITFTASPRPREIRARATKTGYANAVVRLNVRP